MDKKQMEELMKTRVAPMVDRQVVKSVDLLTPAATDQEHRDVPEEAKPTNNQTAEAANMSTDKAANIPTPMNEDLESGKKRGRPRSQAKNLVHFSTWLPQELVWAIQIRAAQLHKKDYEVVTEAIETYLENLK